MRVRKIRPVRHWRWGRAAMSEPISRPISRPISKSGCLYAITESGVLVVHSLPVTLSWVPRDVVNDVYNVGGTITVGTFDSVEGAKSAAVEQYQVGEAHWQVGEHSPFDADAPAEIEIHTPEIDGHNFVRHGIRWR